jgi:hypothetical protein
MIPILTLPQQAMTPITPLEPGAEMFMRGRTQSLFFAARSDKPRPISEATEIFDTDFDDDSSEFEEDSPKYSFQSVSCFPGSPMFSFSFTHQRQTGRQQEESDDVIKF